MLKALFVKRMKTITRSNHMSNAVNRLFYTKFGQVIISILFGMSLALMFHQVCKGKHCIIHVAPPSRDVTKKVFGVQDKCYEYVPDIVPCQEQKQT